MDDTSAVCRVQGVDKLHCQCQGHFDLHWPTRKYVTECDALQKLHDHERPAFVLLKTVNSADMRMIQSRGDSSFTSKPCQTLGILCDVVGKELQRDWSTKPGIFRL